ncbi:hypothetical protein DFQ12_2395 [Sphingobacterium detergens]|uniref:Uncharacterized protein n=1 Tax=Sphingobacterium detergens TaxID=1145106 RepID=A0A420BLD1_SPHD1|nr:hypothetical protein DFQ12_2395 [Sphingobacterium detergens]
MNTIWINKKANTPILTLTVHTIVNCIAILNNKNIGRPIDNIME